MRTGADRGGGIGGSEEATGAGPKHVPYLIRFHQDTCALKSARKKLQDDAWTGAHAASAGAFGE